jgi:hypothetical protein
MGRVAEGYAVWRGTSGAVTAYLESDGITLRGEVRAKLRRDGLMDWRVEGEDLCLRSEGEALVLTLGAKEAATWVRSLEKPLPSLAAKLGVSPDVRAWVIGGPAPEELAVAVAGARSSGPQGVAMIIAVLTAPADLSAALEAGQATGLRVWCVHGKGRSAVVGDAAVRQEFRDAGWMDIKTSAVSDAFSATLYRPPKD